MGNFAENLNLGNRFRPPPPDFDHHFGFLGSLKAMIWLNFDFLVFTDQINVQIDTRFIVIRALEVKL